MLAKEFDLTVRCSAKLNLYLDVTGKREDGYHTIQSIFQAIGIYDTIHIKGTPGDGIAIHCDIPGIPCDESNLAYKAAQKFMEYFPLSYHLVINIEKEIPSGAGMGGGSSDAAAILWTLYQYTDRQLDFQTLLQIAKEIGADVPFFFYGGICFAEGIGEQLTPLQFPQTLYFVILKGEETISTPKAYAEIDAFSNRRELDWNCMLTATAGNSVQSLAEACANVFEQTPSCFACESVQRAKQDLFANGASCAVMTGSGSAVFGMFTTCEKAQQCLDMVGDRYAFARYCTSIHSAIEIVEGGEWR